MKKIIITAFLSLTLLTSCNEETSIPEIYPIPDKRELPPPNRIYPDGNPFNKQKIEQFLIKKEEIPGPMKLEDYYYINPYRVAPSPQYY